MYPLGCPFYCDVSVLGMLKVVCSMVIRPSGPAGVPAAFGVL
jgi:hypothetical protein